MDNQNNNALSARVTDPADQSIVALDEAAKKASLISAAQGSPFASMVRMANAIAVIKSRLTDAVMAPVMDLQGSPLGYRTDKPYPVSVVRDALIEATLRGLPPIGNCWNIISGRCYVTKEGFKFLLDRVPGLRWQVWPGVPVPTKQNEAEAPVRVVWQMPGDKEENITDLRFAVRVNAGMSADAVVGKATRKAEAWLHARVTGLEAPEGSAEEPPLRANDVGRVDRNGIVGCIPAPVSAPAKKTLGEVIAQKAS